MSKQKQKKNPVKVVVVIAIVAALAAAGFFAAKWYTGETGPLQTAAYEAEARRIQDENTDREMDYQIEKMNFENSLAASSSSTEEVRQEAEDLYTVEIDGEEWRLEDKGSAGLRDTRSETVSRADALNGGLLLVNTWHSLPSDFSEDGLISVTSLKISAADHNVKLFPVAAQALSETLEAAKEAGMEHYIVREGYRSVSDQEELFNQKMAKLTSKYSGTKLLEMTKKEVNYPGTSDYHSGMSFRMDLYQSGVTFPKFQSASEQGAWLTANCWKYGIIFRFPTKDFPNASWEDKSYITGVSSQLNLYRYVGKAHSAVMKITGMCLEEYIQFLMDHPHICVYVGGELRYEVVRLSAASTLTSYTIPVANTASSYQYSLDNMEGIVVAYTYN